MENAHDAPGYQPLNILRCDRCRCVEYIVPIEIKGDTSVEKMEQLAQDSFFAVKRTFGERGWFTSVGYDFCPDCCKGIGIQPGYSENGLLPEIMVRPRSHNE